MNPAHPPQPRRKRWRVVRWMLLALLITGAWFAWRVYDHRQAVKEAESLGWLWEEDSLYTKVEKDWRALFRKDSWQSPVRELAVLDFEELQRRSDLAHRLRPNRLRIGHDTDSTGLDALRDLPPLDGLWVSHCNYLRDLASLRHQPHLTMLSLYHCYSLENLDEIQSLHKLEDLTLCTNRKLTNLDALAACRA